MSEVDRYFHEVWLGMVQPIDGLVVSIPVLVDAQCMERQPPHVQQKLLELCPPTREGEAGPEGFQIAALAPFLSELLGLGPEMFDGPDALPEALSLYVPEGHQTLRPTLALERRGDVPKPDGADATPASSAGARYELLVWEIPAGLDLDKPEAITGTWDYPPIAKFDRLLRHCRVPIGLLVNGESVRLIFAPHGESSGAITFRLDDMASVGGRPILDAFVMLLSANRFFGVTEERTLPALLAESRKRQANVTNDLADQVFEALQILLRGFESAAERDGRDLLDDALAREGDHLYKGLLTVLLRLVFVLYAEDRGLLPVDKALYEEHLSVLSLFDQLQADRGAYPDSMARRFGAWGRLVTLFRAIFLGASHGELMMPPRQGSLFNPHEYPFLEGWGPAGSAPITQPEDRAAVKLPTVDDETVFRVLERLLVFEGQRLSYRVLDVEQIGSVYEALMGYHVLRVPSEAVCVKPDRIWVSAEEALEVPAAHRAKWLKETLSLSGAQCEKLNEELKTAQGKQANQVALAAFGKFAAGGKNGDPSLSKARPGQLVLQPGTERRRTSSHYTPRSLSAPIVRRTLEPLLAVMGEAPASERILNLKVCDPAMGSGAFLVEACRFLADHVLAAWTRELRVEAIAAEHGDPLLHARRLVAQRCLYGVDKNDAAVELAKLSLWLVTLSRTLPFTFLDHALRHGDSLVGLDFDQIRSFHWKRPEKETPKQLELFGREIAIALDEAIVLRQRICDLGDSPTDDREKARLFWDAQDALDRVRLIGDLVVGAFFAHESDRDREAERAKRESLVRAWLLSGGPLRDELVAMKQAARATIPIFHWMVEFPEVFYSERPDPLDEGQINRAAFMDGFLGNPPFMAGGEVSGQFGNAYRDWLLCLHTDAHGNSDLVAHFFRRADSLLGAHGTIGLIGTKTVAEGDTRTTGLQALIRGGHVIHHAVRSMPWPGNAAVSVAVVNLAKGRAAQSAPLPLLDSEPTTVINSQLRGETELVELQQLKANRDLCSQGVHIYGNGFVVEQEEYEALVRQSPTNAKRLSPYLGGEEVTTEPTQRFHRYVIDFREMSFEEASAWPGLLHLVEQRVRTVRDAMRSTPINDRMQKLWWRYWAERTDFFAGLSKLERCIVTPQTSKHHVFAFQPVDRVFSQTLYVFGWSSYEKFALLQSRLHGLWASRLCSSMENRLRYLPTQCFETFPMHASDAGAGLGGLETVGKRVYDFRAKYMVDENVGLTITYNRLKDPACDDPRVLELRELHEEMDQKVIEAYAQGDPGGRWFDLEVPPFCSTNEDDRKRLSKFESALIGRLFALNAKRAEEEKVKGLGGAAKRKARTKSSKATHAKRVVECVRETKPPTQQLLIAGTEPTDTD